MNRQRRKSIKAVMDQLTDLKDSLEDICSEEEEYRDNMPDGLQNSVRYEAAEEAISALQTAIEDIENAVDMLSDAVS